MKKTIGNVVISCETPRELLINSEKIFIKQYTI